jgi:hypothetical protein
MTTLENQVYIHFKTLSWKPIKGAESELGPSDGSYPLSLLRSLLILYGLHGLALDTLEFRQFSKLAMHGGDLDVPKPFDLVVRQILKYYQFDLDVLELSPGMSRTEGNEFFLDTVRDPNTGHNIIVLKQSVLGDETAEILQTAYISELPDHVIKIHRLLHLMRVPQVMLQDVVDCISSSQVLEKGLKSFAQRITRDDTMDAGPMELFLLLGQTRFREWILQEIVNHSNLVAPPDEKQFHYPTFNFSGLPSIKPLNGKGLIETVYILGFLGLADDLKRRKRS